MGTKKTASTASRPFIEASPLGKARPRAPPPSPPTGRVIGPTHTRFLYAATHAQLCTDLMDQANALTLEHMDRPHERDLHHRSMVDRNGLNSPFWILAHLAVTQNRLILRDTCGPFQKFSWAKQFTIGATPPPQTKCLPFEEVPSTYQAVHELAMAHTGWMSAEALRAPHMAMTKLGGGNDLNAVNKHHIRHASSRHGHLG